ncbi:hypothetical protein RhiirA1_470980 [Rhizophagus irregularis]|uniref:F-box domain-containing protein n=1 Tax=Rhizophagus irregularis TaxID=588596 RepID=A0A2N0R547_9GLOM|nr:hypothetical protein RhiirA1_470980 [Rhizophagus irregularis]
MACSKLFSGDLPELIDKVIQYFRHDHKTLRSCILVNRLWCRLAIPLLWEDPFSIKFPKNYQFIEIYLRNLNDDYKTKLNEYVVHNNDLFSSNTLFNYTSFIQCLDISKVYYSIEKWITTVEFSSSYSIRNAILSYSLIELIYKSLFLIFIENKNQFNIIYCHSLDSKFIQQIVNITKPFKLKSLFLHGEFVLQIESFKSLVQKAGNYLENFGIVGDISQQMSQLIMKYCSKIKHLDSNLTNNESVNILLRLIENITQNLNYLTINDRGIGYNSILLFNLGQILPFKLEYLSLILSVNTSDLEVLFKNSQNTFIKKLLIRNNKKDENQDIFPYIKEHVMKKKRVKYLAILENCHGKREDLFSQKDKVKEFQLYDIQVSNYDDLFINVYDFINEID